MRGHIMNVETSYYGVSVAGETRLVGSNSCHAVRASRKAVVLCPGRCPSLCRLCPYRAFTFRMATVLCFLYSVLSITSAKIQHGRGEVRISEN